MTTLPPKEKNKVFGLDLMRVLAILLVLSAHTLWIYHDYSNLLTKAINFSGFMGVELFFVLSGFLIGRSLLRLFVSDGFNHDSASRFLKRRAFRIMPSYLLVLILNITVFSLLGYQITDPWKYFVFLQNLWHPMLPFFPESWSMAIKEIPYFILPFVFLLLAPFTTRCRERAFVWIVVTVLLLAFLAKVAYHFHQPVHTLAQWNVSLRSVALFRMDAVMLGILAGWVQLQYPDFWKRMAKPMLCFSLVLFATLAILVGFIHVDIAQFPAFWNIFFLPLISVASAALLPFFSLWTRGPQRLEAPVAFLGGVSYSVYLLHYSLVLYLMKYYTDTHSFSIWQLHGFTAAYLCVTFVLSWLLYTFFEKPLLKLRNDYGT